MKRRMSEERRILEEANKSLFEKGFIKKDNGDCVYDLKTEYGRVLYMFNMNVIEGLFAHLAFDFLAKLDGLPTTVDEMKEKFGIPEETYVDAEFDIPDEVKEEFENAAQHGIKYFIDNLPEMFVETFTRCVEETFCRSLLDQAGKGYYVFNKTDSVVFDEFIKTHGKELKKRMKIRKASGGKTEWTAERKQELFSLYDSTKGLIKQAKDKYRIHIKNGNKDWQKDIEEEFPALNPDIIEQFALKDKESEPWMLALREVLKHFGKSDQEGEYIKKLLREARH